MAPDTEPAGAAWRPCGRRRLLAQDGEGERAGAIPGRRGWPRGRDREARRSAGRSAAKPSTWRGKVRSHGSCLQGTASKRAADVTTATPVQPQAVQKSEPREYPKDCGAGGRTRTDHLLITKAKVGHPPASEYVHVFQKRRLRNPDCPPRSGFLQPFGYQIGYQHLRTRKPHPHLASEPPPPRGEPLALAGRALPADTPSSQFARPGTI